MHHGYSLFHRKPRPKFEIEALFRLVMLYTDTKKYTPHCMIKAKKYSSRYYCIGTHDIKTIINNQIHIVGSLINIQMNLNRSFYFQKGLSFCADNDIFSSSRSIWLFQPKIIVVFFFLGGLNGKNRYRVTLLCTTDARWCQFTTKNALPNSRWLKNSTPIYCMRTPQFCCMVCSVCSILSLDPSPATDI
ncbi:hypothetical protein AGLY_018332 [Aphis glycines]|uniref:Uncharacterized protein n=1 Tax=Aphis glycines TaxID=307491 RepID=A0A6G0SSH8_APHGL|nr:hypothetical protein AGLY_018332 [Aphis glycines]